MNGKFLHKIDIYHEIQKLMAQALSLSLIPLFLLGFTTYILLYMHEPRPLAVKILTYYISSSVIHS